MPSRSTTPLSSTETLSLPPSPSSEKFTRVTQNVFNNPRVQPFNIIEFIASRSSSTVYVFDLAEHIGFGGLTKSWTHRADAATFISLQTRAGAGLSLVGRLSEGTSRDTIKGAVLTAFTTPTGLSAMAESLWYLPPASPNSRLVLQIPTAISLGENFALSPSLAPLATTFATLPPDIAVLLSATPQEAVDIATLSYKLTSSHVIHLFDHYSYCREIGHEIKSPVSLPGECLSVSSAISAAGYAPFAYTGDQNAHTVIVLLNGPLALVANAVASRVRGLGVVAVRVLRPWDESALLSILSTTVKHVHVLDDVPNLSTQGNLYVDVFGTVLDSATSRPVVHGHRIIPEQTQEYFTKPASFTEFISSITSPDNPVSFEPSISKKLLFFSVAGTASSLIPRIVQDTFLHSHAISTRLLTDHDACSKFDTITADRMLLSLDSTDNTPIPVALPLDVDSLGESDFLGVFDHTLLTSHSILKYAKPGSEVLIVTPWSVAEFTTKVATDVLSLVVERDIHVLLIDAANIATKLVGASGPTHDAMQTLIVHLAFLRLYLGPSASESLVLKTARFTFENVVQGIQLAEINARAWAGLVEVDLTADTDLQAAPAITPLKEYEFNTITTEQGKKESSPGAHLGTWHDAARHILFPSIFTPPAVTSTEKYPQNPALRPEISDRTFLVTCTVNRRLTPLEYDRNVFHLEFDTTGTGLAYAIGEALGVHGWNDEQEVLDFCARYGVDPERLITIPIVGGDDKMHTRTVLQALQQQIDLFGRPPKSFYADLSAYATTSADKLALQFIGSPEGSATFKKLSEKDTVTFADVLTLFPSARPGIEILCGMIGDIKPRHYSIASAQAVVGNRVDLLVVSVEWLSLNGDFHQSMSVGLADESHFDQASSDMVNVRGIWQVSKLAKE